MLCSYVSGNKCSGITATGNIAAGVVYVGITIPGHDCSSNDFNRRLSSHTISDNVAHSSNRNGIIVFPDPSLSSSSTCYQGSGLVAYKT